MRKVLWVIVLAACGSKQPPPGREDVVTHERTVPADAQKPPPTDKDLDEDETPRKGVRKAWSGPPPACPASFTAAAGNCPVEQDCEYPQGTCRCEEPGHCGGANIRRPPEPLEWSCEAKVPKVRPDGCPGAESPGQACKREGQECTYGSCCVSVLTCDGGHWVQKKPTECPP